MPRNNGAVRPRPPPTSCRRIDEALAEHRQPAGPGPRATSTSWELSRLLVPERGYYVQKEPLERLRADSTPGIFERLGVTPKAEM